MIDSFEKLTIGKYMDIKEIVESEISESDKQVGIVAVLCDMEEDDVLDLPIGTFHTLVQSTGFIYESPRKRVVATKYVLGGMELDVMLDLKKLSVAQYLDYQTYVKDPDKYLVELLSVFLVPKGKKYGAYDIEEVQEVISDHLSIVDAVSLSAFFLTLYQSLIKVTTTSLTKNLKKMKKKMKNQEEMKKMEEVLQNLEAVGDGLELLTEYQKR